VAIAAACRCLLLFLVEACCCCQSADGLFIGSLCNPTARCWSAQGSALAIDTAVKTMTMTLRPRLPMELPAAPRVYLYLALALLTSYHATAQRSPIANVFAGNLVESLAEISLMIPQAQTCHRSVNDGLSMIWFFLLHTCRCGPTATCANRSTDRPITVRTYTGQVNRRLVYMLVAAGVVVERFRERRQTGTIMQQRCRTFIALWGPTRAGTHVRAPFLTRSQRNAGQH
jgi:hypothetical protein